MIILSTYGQNMQEHNLKHFTNFHFKDLLELKKNLRRFVNTHGSDSNPRHPNQRVSKHLAPRHPAKRHSALRHLA